MATTTSERAGGNASPSPREKAERGSSAAGAPAGLWRRGAALAIDYGILAAATVGIARGLEALGLEGEGLRTVSSLASFATIVLYFAGMEGSRRGATVGKLALGVRVSDEQGDRIGFSRALGRTFGKLLSLIPFGVGFLMAAFSDRHRALHDLLAGTVVQRAA
ncbi:RDD family protein [Tautonia sociabilis]|uniref:RDD family protein n=1 Tax=Tautonia sociabilis TaxID=2080755 RepID=A0A432MQ11_9BACT|nr:RDD family protein [Tautonia sociabilis]RUL89237.1 RDD family protein [Tautonia sociabilis]